jgi:hypothetical protein
VTQAELEFVAREMRDRGLHYSWNELLAFAEDVVGSLASAYQTLLRSMAKSNTVSSTDPDDAQKVVRDKLVKALTLLTDKAQVAKWESEALPENNCPGMNEVEDLRFEGNQSPP